ncbi:FHIP family protein AAEL005291 isoform X1 [Armigeres subalbatus]|uniref:FHIP family protein AAEL005291 isoform X1 n=2 Tax=Armigeres subalbatus TaxID=124917 RepID=UPI002ED1C823
MSWLRSSPLRQSFGKSGGGSGSSGRGSSSTNGTVRAFDASECDPKACYDSFCIHWQQAYEIIQRSENNRGQSHDDVLGVVTHLDHMVTLLLVELHHCNKLSLPGAPAPAAPCLEHLLSENLLDKLYEWGVKTGRYANAVRLEQLKLYEQLVSHSRHQLLVHEPFLRPLLKILASSQNEIYPPDVEKRLVILLNQLCVVLMQNVHLLDLFFFSTAQQQNGSGGHTNFIIFSLLIPYVHREGSLGHQARDALLLCMALSQKNSNVGTYIATYSSICPVLVTGLGGLYSRLPNQIDIKTIDWYRITTDDVTEMQELTLFMNSLEFCNAVVQVAHSMIRQQLLDFLYQGFLVPVLGPAILQTFKGRGHLQTNVESQVSAMAYLDLIVRSVTEPGLIQIVVKFLLDEEKFDGQRILDVLVERLNSNDSRLCMISLSLFDTLLSLNCEDIMLELILKYLLSCQHVPISHRFKVNRVDPYSNAVEYFLNTTPEIMKKVNNVLSINNNNNYNQSPMIGSGVTSNSQSGRNISKTIGANWNHYGINTGETLLANYQAYLLEARNRIVQCKHACDQWNNMYRYQKLSKLVNNSNSVGPNGSGTVTSEDVQAYKVQMIKNFLAEFTTGPDSAVDLTAADIDRSSQCQSPAGMFGTGGGMHGSHLMATTSKQLDSLQSLGDSSGYESLNITNLGTGSEDGRRHETWKVSSVKEETIVDLDLSEDLFAQGTVSLGPFLTAIWGKLQTFTSNCLYVNLHLTGLISHLSWFPLPLLHSILLRPDIPTTSDTPSFHQVLKILKQQIDAELPDCDESLEIVDVARSFLVDREFRLINMRKNAIESNPNSSRLLLLNGGAGPSGTVSMTSSLSQTTPMQLTPSSSYDPFKRNDSKRKSISNSFSSIFRRPGSSASSGIAQVFQFFTGGGSNSNNSPASHQSSATPSPAGSQQYLSSNSSGVSSFMGSSRRDSREAETQFVDHPSSLGGPTASSLTATGSPHNSLEYSLVNINGSIVGGIGSERQRDLAVSAVVLDEWLKELSAITQEQCIMMVSDQVLSQKLGKTS